MAVIWRKAGRIGAQTLVWLIIGLGLLAGSAATLYLSTRNDLLTAYNSAPTCATIAGAVAGMSCRYTAAARVIQVVGENGSVTVYFDMPEQYAPFFQARLPVSDTALRDGDEVQVELWQMKVTRLDGVLTSDNPANDPRPETFLVIGLLVLPLGFCATGWGIITARRDLQGPQVQSTPSPTMSPVAMSDVLWR